MAQLDKTFPTLDCSACILTPKMTDVKAHPNITLWTYSEVTEVGGFVGNFEVKVERKPRYIIEDLCVGCYECIEACVFKKGKFSNEFDEGLSLRKPVFIPFPQAVPLAPVIDPTTCIQFKSGRCKQTCVDACGDRGAVDLKQEAKHETIEVGTIILATGYKPFTPTRLPQYGYGTYPNVYTALEVERLVNSSGPTGGEIVLRDGRPAAVILDIDEYQDMLERWKNVLQTLDRPFPHMIDWITDRYDQSVDHGFVARG